MANEEHLAILKQGVEVWNEWRQAHDDIRPDLREADLIQSNLSKANLNDANLRDANLIGASLIGANLSDADLREANLSDADLRDANLIGADLRDADLSGANLSDANLSDANLSDADLGFANLSKANLYGTYLSFVNLNRTNLSEADLNKAIVESTTFGDVDLSVAKGLNTVEHLGSSTIGIDTIYASHGDIPEAFLKGAGVDDTFITYIRALVSKPIEYYSCFISYSSKDDAFAKRLYADLQSNNVRCWFAPEHMKIGDEIRSRIDESIRTYDKLLLVLSAHSVESVWVKKEVETAFEKEGQQNRIVLFPVRLDEAVMQTTKAWAADIRRMRHIGDFTYWKDHDTYQKAFDRLLRDLKAETQR
jgi:uncharacterized protein YjbI with pentapeptide repeats